MKRFGILLLSAAILFFSFGCGGSSGASVSVEQASMALGVSMAAFMFNSFAIAFGQEVEGISYDEDSQTMTFTEYKLTDLKEDMGDEMVYTSISGTLKQGESESISADLTLVGGPVKTIQYELPTSTFEGETPAIFKITVNGKTMEIDPSKMENFM